MDRRKRRRLLSALQSGILEDIRSVSNTAIASFTGDGRDLVRLVVGIDPVQAGSGDPSPDNIRPISGWTEAKVTRTGKNMVNGADFTTFASWKDDLVLYGSFPTTTSNRAYLIPTFSGLTYSISLGMTSDNFAEYVYFCSADGTNSARLFAFSTNVFNANTYTFTAESGKFYYIRSGSMATETAFNTQIALIGHCQLELGSTATAYEPYQGQTYIIDLDGTRYGGTLDVTAGKLTLDRAITTIGSMTWTYQSANTRFFSNTLRGMVMPAVNNTTPLDGLICSCYKTSYVSGGSDMSISAWGPANPGDMLLRDSNFTDEDTMIAAVGSQTIVYPLATPIEVQLTPTQITTLPGANNIWADTGDIILLEYMA